jgi:transcriptional regulator with XRE-family HTH domain
MIGENLRKLRTVKTNFSQREVAEQLGVDRNTYAKWENNETDVKSEYLPKLAETFNVQIGDLFEKPNEKVLITNNKYEAKDNSILTGTVIILNNDETLKKFMRFLEQEKNESPEK